MYNQKLVVCIKTAGKILKEFNKDQVRVPFGSEYSIYLKNLNNVRALVHISIDGKSVDGGDGLVILPNETLDLERSLQNGNMLKGNKFKFIERTAKVEAHRGIEAEDGIIRVEFQFEKQTIVNEIIEKYKIIKEKEYVYPPYLWPYDRGHWEWKRDYYNQPIWCHGPVYGSAGLNNGGLNGSLISTCMGIAGQATTANVQNASMPAINSVNCVSQSSLGDSQPNATLTTSNGISGQSRVKTKSSVLRSSAVVTEDASVENEAGITVEGSISDQQFHTAAWFDVESTKHVVVLKLVGATSEGIVKKAVTSKTKQTCKNCATRNRGQNKCCRECGTSLEIV